MLETQRPTEAEVQKYTSGKCMVFAAALSELFGYPISVIHYRGLIAHAYCEVDGVAIDIRGREDARAFVERWTDGYHQDDLEFEGPDLHDFREFWNISDDQLAEATAVIKRSPHLFRR